MPANYLEQLAAEWYEYQGYFIRRNVHVGLRSKGGYDCELDVVAFHPGTKHLVHIEPSMDAQSWEQREVRYKKKFDAGRKHIPELFSGFELPDKIEQIALLGFASKLNHSKLGGGDIKLVSEFITEIIITIKESPIASKAITEDKPILRTLQFVCEYKKDIDAVIYR